MCEGVVVIQPTNAIQHEILSLFAWEGSVLEIKRKRIAKRK